MQRKDGLPPFERRGMNPFQRFASRLKHGLDAKRREIGAKLDAKRAELDAKREDLVATFMAKHDLGAGVYAPNRAERRTEKKNRKQESARETARGAKVHLVLNSIKVADPAMMPGVQSSANTANDGAAAKESGSTKNSAPAAAEKKEKKAPNSATAVFGPKLKPQKVTVDDLSAQDRAAILGVPLTARNLAGAAMFAFAVYAVSKAAIGGKNRGKDEDDAGKGASKFSRFGLLDLDSAFTTTPAKGNTPRRSGTKGASPVAEIECDSTSKQLLDQLERVAIDVPKAAAEMLRNGLTPAKKTPAVEKTPAKKSKRAVKRVNPACVRAKQRRKEGKTTGLASSGRLVAKVLGVSLAAAADSCKGAAAGVDAQRAAEYSVRIECRRGDKLMGGVTSKRGVDKDGKTVDVRQKMRFNLPAAKDEGEITLRLCDAKGKTVARSGLTLVDVLRVSPVTKDFQLFGRDMRTFANAKLAFTWEPNA